MVAACRSQPRSMIDNSKKWAMARNLLRTNQVHGEEEWRIPVDETYTHTSKRGQSTRMRGNMQLEDRDC